MIRIEEKDYFSQVAIALIKLAGGNHTALLDHCAKDSNNTFSFLQMRCSLKMRSVIIKICFKGDCS